MRFDLPVQTVNLRLSRVPAERIQRESNPHLRFIRPTCFLYTMELLLYQAATWTHGDSNPKPSPCKGDALPIGAMGPRESQFPSPSGVPGLFVDLDRLELSTSMLPAWRFTNYRYRPTIKTRFITPRPLRHSVFKVLPVDGRVHVHDERQRNSVLAYSPTDSNREP